MHLTTTARAPVFTSALRCWAGVSRFAHLLAAMVLSAATLSSPAQAADLPAPREGDWRVPDFRFHDGSTLPELTLHYTTLGSPDKPAVLVLHGTLGSGKGLLTPGFGGELFGPGQPLDANRYFIILPDGIGTGESSRPSQGLRARFPHYNYEDMVRAQHRLVTEHLGIRHLRMVLGYSMGGMHTWLWAQLYPGFMDIAVPMAALPVPMAGRNWMLRRLVIDSIRNDPAWKNGDYTEQPPSLRFASVYFNLATNGGSQALYRQAPTREKADQLLDQRLQAPFKGDANDHLYQWEASGDYDPSADLERIRARVLAINSADDERNPPELGVLERELKRLPHGALYIVPGSPTTAGHGTLAQAALWKAPVAQLLQNAPRLD
ncbi:alpha/beta fold hydrolase [Curvibacter gracilis]|uniref:alpha/beta fold hydrolase n=1 Tax=Curvibacter gracilis TaxID=230310 RepID=UPI0004B0142C|nr:alpha/beta fold hydrolase [Curvibacter gracilis]